MSTPITWLEGQARGKLIGLRRKIGHLLPGYRDHTRTRQRINYAYKMMRNAEDVREHIEACYREIDRLGGRRPGWRIK